MQRIKISDNQYNSGDKVEFFNKYVFKVIIKTDSKRLYYVCVCSKYLRKVN